MTLAALSGIPRMSDAEKAVHVAAVFLELSNGPADPHWQRRKDEMGAAVKALPAPIPDDIAALITAARERVRDHKNEALRDALYLALKALVASRTPAASGAAEGKQAPRIRQPMADA